MDFSYEKTEDEKNEGVEIPSFNIGFPKNETFRRVDIYSDDFDDKLSKKLIITNYKNGFTKKTC